MPVTGFPVQAVEQGNLLHRLQVRAEATVRCASWVAEWAYRSGRTVQVASSLHLHVLVGTLVAPKS
jgi:hypothetical protein